MKMIVAIIQPFMLDRVLRGLRGKVHGLTCWDVRGFGIEATQAHFVQDAADYLSHKVRIEIVVEETAVETIVSTIQRLAHTGQSGDGKIFVLAVEEALRIRTGQVGAAAI
ncbi:P-II family nitrogen regulator [Gloeobacter kilaueensis]|uniref:Nitrogen regulatory protein P-II n=1 Tax=Gloeobacter kilaueensis (strain ATCC BAA-2537 / CCAP 1431/1 / ULC 316 / JS1) TaxID=1183438 RepID=U5QM73_GLOK1|nr:P-II family nitrogen regulator [Gloeobacter kilaueensis]AGY60087.1 nitrogen regulatory protein P-II [Gloeobacter kilaueensis JS1]